MDSQTDVWINKYVGKQRKKVFKFDEIKLKGRQMVERIDRYLDE